MEKIEVPKSRVVQGPGLVQVALAGLVLVGLILVMVYFAASNLPANRVAHFVQLVTRQVGKEAPMAARTESQAREEPEKAVSIETPASHSVVPTPQSSKTIDIGAYLTYGGQAFTLSRASAKLAADRSRLAIGMFEGTQGEKEKPALSMLIEFKRPELGCKVANVKELTLLFDLRAMGSIGAQKVQVVKRTPTEIQLALTDFSCELRPSGTVRLHSLGSDPSLLKPKGTSFGWGVRLAQEIG